MLEAIEMRLLFDQPVRDDYASDPDTWQEYMTRFSVPPPPLLLPFQSLPKVPSVLLSLLPSSFVLSFDPSARFFIWRSSIAAFQDLLHCSPSQW